MALDEPKEDDKVFEIDDLTYLVDPVLMEQASPIKIDFVDNGYQSGFTITSRLSAGANCGGSCSC